MFQLNWTFRPTLGSMLVARLISFVVFYVLHIKLKLYCPNLYIMILFKMLIILILVHCESKDANLLIMTR